MARTATTALYGRDRELAVLREALSSLRLGMGVVVVIEGTPGIGKSRLLAEAMRMAGRRKVRVCLGEADPSEAVVELAPLLRALFDGAVPLLERSALPAVRGGPEQRYWLVQDLESLLEGAAVAGPVLVCLDDLQWADGGTLAALRALPARLESVPVAWVLAARMIQPGSAVDGVVEQLASQGARRIVLEPLTPEAVAEFASEVMGASPEQALLELAADAAGNPFFLVECCADCARSGSCGSRTVWRGCWNRGFPSVLAPACATGSRACRSLPASSRRGRLAGSQLHRRGAGGDAAGSGNVAAHPGRAADRVRRVRRARRPARLSPRHHP